MYRNTYACAFDCMKVFTVNVFTCYLQIADAEGVNTMPYFKLYKNGKKVCFL